MGGVVIFFLAVIWEGNRGKLSSRIDRYRWELSFGRGHVEENKHRVYTYVPRSWFNGLWLVAFLLRCRV